MELDLNSHNTMDLTAINSTMDAAFSAALANPQKAAPAQVGDDPNQTVQTDTYVAPTGSGFRVVGRLKVGGYTAICVRNHGPDTKSERDWPSEGIEATAAAHVQRCIAGAETHIARSFSTLILMDGLKRIMAAIAAGTLASIPKTVAVATWVETVKQTALAGSNRFPPAPFTVAEVLAE